MKLVWDEVGKKFYETGVSKGVLYLQEAGAYPTGVAWNGLTTVTEKPSGAEATPFYADNKKYLNLTSTEEFGATIECFTYPDEFAECDGSKEAAKGLMVTQQARKPFGFSYQTLLGNDEKGTDLGYKIHLVYGALAAVSEKAHGTVNEKPEAMPFSYELTTTAVEIKGHKPSAHLIIDSTKCDPAKLLALETILYGSSEDPGTEAKLPLPDEIITLLGAVAAG